MKKATILAVLSVMALLAQSAWADISITANPAGPTIVSAGGTFTEDILYTSTAPPPDLGAFDLIFEGAATQNGSSIGGFAITGNTPNPSRTDWQIIAPDFTNDAFGAHTTSDHTGFLQTEDEGYSTNLANSAFPSGPFTNFDLGTWTFHVPTGLNPGTYTFQTTQVSTSPNDFSDTISSSSGPNFGTWAWGNSAQFQITIASAIPEPATWALFGLGTLGAFGLNLLRARRKG
jgi:hypothetical protein